MRLVSTLVGTLIISWMTPLNASSPPRAAIAAGYKKLIFSDNFRRFDIGRGGRGAHTWYAGLWYKGVPPAAKIQDKGGFVRLVSLDGKKRGLGTEIHTLARTPQGRSTLFRFGYFEARIRATADLQNFGSFWLESYDHTLDQGQGPWRRYCEIDIAEFGGSINGYAASVIDWIDKKPHQTPWPPVHRIPASNRLDKWNVYGLLWEPGKLSFFFNNQLIRSVKSPPPCDEQRLFMVLSGAKNGGNADKYIDVDWVHVFN
jgi:hypothetical protein